MSVTRWDKRFFDSTRGRVLALIRRDPRTVEELAGALGVTDNAVRAHIAALERDGVIRQSGVRPTRGKPAFSYELVPEVESLFTAAYIPVLTQMIAVLAERMSRPKLDDLLKEVGRRLAALTPQRRGDLRARVEDAANVLTALGDIVEIEESGDTLVLRGYGCPLADAVRTNPAVCRTVEALAGELIGAPVHERCERGARPRCRIEIPLQSPRPSVSR